MKSSGFARFWRCARLAEFAGFSMLARLSMKTFVAVVGAMVLASGAALGAEQTWIGEISDSACGARHESGTENVAPPPAKECTLDCVRGGSKFVLVSEGKVYAIANQDRADLTTHAGETVKMTGEVANGVITVSRVEAVK